MADLASGLDWTPYDSARGGRLRVRDIIIRGATEYELCTEGGQMLIRRIVCRNGSVITSEACRGLARHTEAAWSALLRSASGTRNQRSVSGP